MHHHPRHCRQQISLVAKAKTAVPAQPPLLMPARSISLLWTRWYLVFTSTIKCILGMLLAMPGASWGRCFVEPPAQCLPALAMVQYGGSKAALCFLCWAYKDSCSLSTGQTA